MKAKNTRSNKNIKIKDGAFVLLRSKEVWCNSAYYVTTVPCNIATTRSVVVCEHQQLSVTIERNTKYKVRYWNKIYSWTHVYVCDSGSALEAQAQFRGIVWKNMAKLYLCHCNLVLAIRKAQGKKVHQKSNTFNISFLCHFSILQVQYKES